MFKIKKVSWLFRRFGHPTCTLERQFIVCSDKQLWFFHSFIVRKYRVHRENDSTYVIKYAKIGTFNRNWKNGDTYKWSRLYYKFFQACKSCWNMVTNRLMYLFLFKARYRYFFPTEWQRKRLRNFLA